MEQYKNYSDNSGVYAFAVAPNHINVQFNDRSIYRYTYNSTGLRAIEEMKKSALSGRGLNSYINIYVKKSVCS